MYEIITFLWKDLLSSPFKITFILRVDKNDWINWNTCPGITYPWRPVCQILSDVFEISRATLLSKAWYTIKTVTTSAVDREKLKPYPPVARHLLPRVFIYFFLAPRTLIISAIKYQLSIPYCVSNKRTIPILPMFSSS